MAQTPIECTVEPPKQELDEKTKTILEKASNCEIIIPGTVYQQNLASFFELPLPEVLFDPTVEQTLRNYLDSQARLDKLREEFANRICLPYICPIESNQTSYSSVDFSFNGKRITKLPIYKYQGTFRATTQTNFKTILLALKTPYAKWISNNDTIFIDIINFSLDNNIQISVNDSIIKINTENN